MSLRVHVSDTFLFPLSNFYCYKHTHVQVLNFSSPEHCPEPCLLSRTTHESMASEILSVPSSCRLARSSSASETSSRRLARSSSRHPTSSLVGSPASAPSGSTSSSSQQNSELKSRVCALIDRDDVPLIDRSSGWNPVVSAFRPNLALARCGVWNSGRISLVTVEAPSHVADKPSPRTRGLPLARGFPILFLVGAFDFAPYSAINGGLDPCE